MSYVVTPDRYRQSLQKIEAAAHAAGRSLDGFARAHLTFITVGSDFEAARETWVRRLSRRYNQDFAPLAGRYGVIGTPAQCIERLEQFIEAGCDYFLLNAIGDVAHEREQLEIMAAEILPFFRNGGERRRSSLTLGQPPSMLGSPAAAPRQAPPQR